MCAGPGGGRQIHRRRISLKGNRTSSAHGVTTPNNSGSGSFLIMLIIYILRLTGMVHLCRLNATETKVLYAGAGRDSDRRYTDRDYINEENSAVVVRRPMVMELEPCIHLNFALKPIDLLLFPGPAC